MPSPSINVVKLVLSGVLLAIVAVRIAFDSLAERVDETALVLLGLAVLVPLVPWEKLSQFKAAGIELSLEQPQVRGALEGFSGVDNRWIEGLERTLAKVKSELPYVRGSRVLWVDDNPKVILGERRMFRALGAQVVSVTSSEMAEQVLTSDGDFDIVISDIQREGQSYLVNGGVEIHEGVNFVVKMRRSDDSVITEMPVLFYAAYDWQRLNEYARPARESPGQAEVSNSIDMLIEKAVRMIADVRSRPPRVPLKKVPTALRSEMG